MADEILSRYRESIDNIDAALIFMLAERFKVPKAVGEHKAVTGLPAADPGREKIQIERLRDLAKSAKAFKDGAKITPRRVLELCATIRDADEEIDLAEDEYIKKVGKALGLKESDYKDLTLDYDVEEVKAAFAGVSKPPPPPKK